MHYFDDEPGTPDVRRTVDARIWDTDFSFTTASGVFAHDGLDKATQILLSNVEPPAGGTVLDLGCGWGPIATALAATQPELDVWAVDINERARTLTALNAEAAGASVRVAAPDEVPANVSFDEIWSNPPIRIGKDALHQLLQTWLPRLAPGGTAWLVVGKNLGADSLQRWLTDQGWPTARHTSAKGFRVLRVSAPPS